MAHQSLGARFIVRGRKARLSSKAALLEIRGTISGIQPLISRSTLHPIGGADRRLLLQTALPCSLFWGATQPPRLSAEAHHRVTSIHRLRRMYLPQNYCATAYNFPEIGHSIRKSPSAMRWSVQRRDL